MRREEGLLLLVAALLWCEVASSATVTDSTTFASSSNTFSSTFNSLVSTFSAANDYVVVLGAGSFTGCSASITLSTAIKVTIVGGGKTVTTIDCDGSVTGGGALFTANVDTEIKDLTFMDTGASVLLTLSASRDLTVANTLISGCGSILCGASCADIVLTNVDVTLSTAVAVSLATVTSVTVDGCHFYDISLPVGGSPTLYGGALRLTDVPSFTLHDCVFDNVQFAIGVLGNVATSLGGAMSLTDVQGTAEAVTGTDNLAGVGGFAYITGGSNMVWTNCTFSGNSSTHGMTEGEEEREKKELTRMVED